MESLTGGTCQVYTLLLPQINAVDTRPRIVRMGELRNGKTLYDLT
jgi:hypothetical protein